MCYKGSAHETNPRQEHTVSRAIRVDIHIHTRASDGVWSPEELLGEIRKEGIGLFAVTDHDSTANVAESGHLARREGLLFLRGVEINTTFRGRIVHILGYDIDLDETQLQELIAGNRARQNETDYAILRVLEADGFPIDWERFENYSYDRARGGFRGLNFCIDEGFCSDVSDFFGRLFGPRRPLPSPTYPHPREAVEVIRAAGGVPVLAHPFGNIGGAGSTDYSTLFLGLLDEGIMGMECHSPYHSAEQTASARAFCDEHQLLVTGGSDTHGHFTVRRKLGRPEVWTADLRLGELRERAEAAASAAG
jgi:hypothetical protein